MVFRFFFDSHLHTPLCHHAVGEPGDYAREAIRKGLHGIIFTCHTPLPAGVSPAVRMTEAELPRYIEMIDRCREEFAGQVEIRIGLEVDYVPGLESFLEKIISAHTFDYIIGSVHAHLPEIKDRYFAGDQEAFGKKYFELQAEAAETGLFDAIAHPDILKIISWAGYSRIAQWPAILRFLDRLAASGKAIELNTSGLIRAVREFHPSPEFYPEIVQRGIPVVLGSDAHLPERVGESFGPAVDLLGESGLQSLAVFGQRVRQDIPLGQIREALTPALRQYPQPQVEKELRS